MYSDFDGYVISRRFPTKAEWIADLTRYGDGAERSWKANRKQKTVREQYCYADGRKAEEMANAVLFWLRGTGNDWPDTGHDVRPAIDHIRSVLAGS